MSTARTETLDRTDRTYNGLAFIHAQHELNTFVPEQRRAEVSAAFVCCIYVLVGGAVIAIGVIDESGGPTRGVGIVGSLLTAGSLATAGWQVARGRP